MGKVKNKLLEALDEMNDVLMTMTMFNPNNHPVYSIPLSELVNLWRAKFGAVSIWGYVDRCVRVRRRLLV